MYHFLSIVLVVIYHYTNFQVSSAAVEGYTGEVEPPCIVMTLRAVSDETKPPDLSLPVALTGVREQSKQLKIKRAAEGIECSLLLNSVCSEWLNLWGFGTSVFEPHT